MMNPTDDPSQLGPGATEQGEVHARWSTFEKVLQRLHGEGFPVLPMPNSAAPGYLQLNDLTAFDARVLTTKYAHYKEWLDFVAQRLLFSRMILAEVDNELKHLAVRIRRDLTNAAKAGSRRKPSLEDIREEVELNPRYIQLTLQRQEHEQLKDAYDSEWKRFKTSCEVISRHITLRGQEVEKGNRGSAVGATGSPREFG